MDVPARSRPLRVVTMIDALPHESGGGERLAAVLASRLDPARFERILCATRRASGPLLDELLDAGVRVVDLGRKGKADVWRWGKLVSLVRGERVDVLHAHKFGSNVWAALLDPLARPPVLVAHEHSWSYVGRPLRRFLDREVIARRADTIVAVSREDARRMVAVEGIPAAKIQVVPNGVASPVDVPAAADVRRELDVEASALVVGTVGSLLPVKAFDVLVASAALLRERFPSLRVLIVGGGPEDGALRALVRDASLEDVVRLLGPMPRHEVPRFLAALDVAVCCSRHEGSPLSVMEYMAAGLPVVATRVGGLPDLVDDGATGMLVAPEDPAALADAVATLLEDDGLRRAMGERARARQRREFSIEATVATLEDLYETLFSRTARARAESWMPPLRGPSPSL